MNEFDILSCHKVEENLYMVRENWGWSQLINIYVVTGEDKTMVIDSGLGATHGLRRFIEQNITAKTPMDCYVTHSHPDHIGGAVLFDHIYINENELTDLDWNLNNERRVSDAGGFAGYTEEAMKLAEESFIPVDPSSLTFHLISEGETINLGNETFELIWFPGHSAGGMAFYNEKRNYVLAGDAITYTGAFGRMDKAGLENTVSHIRKFIKRVPDDIHIYSGHTWWPAGRQGTMPDYITKDMVFQLIQAFEDVLHCRNLEQDTIWVPMFRMRRAASRQNWKTHTIGEMEVTYNADLFYPGKK